MSSFLELYQTLVGFVNFRLYHCSGLHYPPVFDREREEAGESLFALILDGNAAALEASSTTTTSAASSVRARVCVCRVSAPTLSHNTAG